MREIRLTSVEGAKKIIETLSQKSTVACLDLQYNKLGDEGCLELFKYLRSGEAQRHKVARILLVGNSLGNVALESIGSFIHGNSWLEALYLSSNDFVGDPDVISAFTEALNASSLKFLFLCSCIRLSDAFAERFFPRLNSPHLSNLQLSMIGLTRAAVPHIIEYLSSPRCRPLVTLKLNGNDLSTQGASKIVECIKRANFTITNLEMLGTRTRQGGQDDSSEDSSSNDSSEDSSSNDSSEDSSSNDSSPSDRTPARFEESLRHSLVRNGLLQRQTHAAAFRLLQYSRALLLKPKKENKEEADRSSFCIQSLPTELQLHILSLTVDTLSTNQRIRIFQFATDPYTLPEILPDLRRRQSEGVTKRSLLDKSSAPFTLSPRDANRTRWLQAVGCDLYET